LLITHLVASDKKRPAQTNWNKAQYYKDTNVVKPNPKACEVVFKTMPLNDFKDDMQTETNEANKTQ